MSDGRDAFFKSHVKRSDSTAGLRNELGSEFQTVGPATEKARGCLMCCDETVEYDFTVPMSLLRSFQDHLFNYVFVSFQHHLFRLFEEEAEAVFVHPQFPQVLICCFLQLHCCTSAFGLYAFFVK